MLILAAQYLCSAEGDGPSGPVAIVVSQGRIEAVDRPDAIAAAFPSVETLDLHDCAVLPGLINAHQHGRGVSQILLGYQDDALEPWIASRRRHGAPDIYAVTRLAAEAMLANGVTSTVHANYAYGTGDYAIELNDAVRAYRDSGISATICVGYQDRGFRTYPPAEGPEMGVSPYVGNADSTIALLEWFRDRYRDATGLIFALGPAGPQWVSDEGWRRLSRYAAKQDVGIHFHLLESPAQAQACRMLYGPSTLAHLRRLGVFEARTSCAHGVYMTAEDREVAREEELVIVTNPGANLRLFNGAPPLADLFEAGCTLALGTDNSAVSDDEDYLRELRLGGLLTRRPGVEGRAAGARDLLRIATSHGARAAFQPFDRDPIRLGAPANLIAIDLKRIKGGSLSVAGPILDTILARANGSDVRLTMVNGRIRFQDAPEDRTRLRHWQAAASRSAERRTYAMPAEDVEELRIALRRHYQERIAGKRQA